MILSPNNFKGKLYHEVKEINSRNRVSSISLDKMMRSPDFDTLYRMNNGIDLFRQYEVGVARARFPTMNFENAYDKFNYDVAWDKL
jgi:hypothetical protein